MRTSRVDWPGLGRRLGIALIAFLAAGCGQWPPDKTEFQVYEKNSEWHVFGDFSGPTQTNSATFIYDESTKTWSAVLTIVAVNADHEGCTLEIRITDGTHSATVWSGSPGTNMNISFSHQTILSADVDMDEDVFAELWDIDSGSPTHAAYKVMSQDMKD